MNPQNTMSLDGLSIADLNLLLAVQETQIPYIQAQLAALPVTSSKMQLASQTTMLARQLKMAQTNIEAIQAQIVVLNTPAPVDVAPTV